MLKEWCRVGINNTHHNLPKCRNGINLGNTVRIDIQSHKAWHFLFGTMTFGEVAEILYEIEALMEEYPDDKFNFNSFFALKNNPKSLDIKWERR